MTIAIALLYLSCILIALTKSRDELTAQTVTGLSSQADRSALEKPKDNIFFEMEGGGGWGSGWGSGGGSGGHGSGSGNSGIGWSFGSANYWGPGSGCSCGGDHSSHNCECGCHHSGTGYGNIYYGPYGTHGSSDVCPHCGHTGRAITGPYFADSGKSQAPLGKQKYGFFQRLLQFFEYWIG